VGLGAIHVPRTFKGRVASGLNERLRFYRYDPGQKFDWHQDGYYERENGERSQFTFMVYLNDGFGGGGTSFVDRMGGCSICSPLFPRRARRCFSIIISIIAAMRSPRAANMCCDRMSCMARLGERIEALAEPRRPDGAPTRGGRMTPRADEVTLYR